MNIEEVEAIRARGDDLTCEIERSGQTPERLAQLVEVDRLISEAEDRASIAGSTYMIRVVVSG